jgi:alpha/beta superfamily hydrolase
MMPLKRIEQQVVTFEGPAGSLEGLLSIPEQPGAYVGIVCHPHPLHGGSMNNKVAHFAARAMNEMGLSVLRFNFRGVGKSQGRFDHAVGEVDDCVAASEWVQSEVAGLPVLLAGFSFGSYVAAKACGAVHPVGMISIAPPVNLYRFDQLPDPACPWLVIQGDKDEVVPATDVRNWAENSAHVSDLAWLNGASHFFHGRLLEMGQAMKKWMRKSLENI